MRPLPPHFPQPLCCPDLPLVHSEVVRNFMPEGLLDQTFQILAVAGDALVRTLENRDPVGQLEPFKNAAMRQWASFVQPEERTAGRNSSRPKLARRRLVLHDDRHIIHAVAESRGNVAQCPFHNLIEIRREHGIPNPKGGPSGIVTKPGRFRTELAPTGASG